MLSVTSYRTLPDLSSPFTKFASAVARAAYVVGGLPFLDCVTERWTVDLNVDVDFMLVLGTEFDERSKFGTEKNFLFYFIIPRLIFQ